MLVTISNNKRQTQDKEQRYVIARAAVTLGNVSCNLSRNIVATQVA